MNSIPNAVVNSLLCYLSSARRTYSEQVLIATCLSFYNSDKIEEAKETLFQCLKEAVTKRRGDNKSRSDLIDMLDAMKKVDANKIDIPKFLCDGFGNMPPCSGFEVISEHLLELVMQVTNLKESLREFETKSERKDDTAFREMQEDIKDIKLSIAENQIHRDDSLHNSRTPQNTRKNQFVRKAIIKGDSLPGSSKSNPGSHSSQMVSKSTHNTEPANDSLLPAATISASVTSNERSSSESQENVAAESGDSPETEDTEEGGAWNTVVRRKKRNIIKGTLKSDSSLKGVGISRDLYVGRCHPSVSSNVLTEFIESTAGFTPQGCAIISKSDAPVKSFKVTVSEAQFVKLMDPAMWPEDVRVRKYFNGRMGVNFRSV